MKYKALVSIFFLIFILNYDYAKGQAELPDNWPEIIRRPWYQGIVDGKPVFFCFNTSTRNDGFFFIADKAIPDIYQVIIKTKKDDRLSLKFRIDGKKTRVKYNGTIRRDTISGLIRVSRRISRRLDVPAGLPVFMTMEKPIPLPAVPQRYNSKVFKTVDIEQEISYGAASGYYASLPVEADTGYDYQAILLDAIKKMYVSPTRQALLYILDKDPVSLVLSDLQGLRLDLWEPIGDTLKNRPLLLMLHGGAFIMGDKASNTIRELAFDFTRKGYVVATVNYRMGFNPASKSSLERSAYRAVQDARAALRFLSYNAEKYRIDPDCIFLAGSSAGAITALNSAFMKEDERPESSGSNFWLLQKDLGGLDESTNTLQQEYRIRAVANLWGAVHDTNLIDRDEQIPVMNFHGDADKIVPFGCNYPFMDLDTSLTSNIVTKLYGSQYIHRRLRNLGIHSELVVFPGLGHEPQFEKDKYQVIMDTIIERSTEFFLNAMFYFPEIKGPGRIRPGDPTAFYSVSSQEDVSYYWKIEGGKFINGKENNRPGVAMLARGKGKISLVMLNRNKAGIEIEYPVKLPENEPDYFPFLKK